MKCIDLENHFYPSCVIDALASRETPPYYRTDTDTIVWNDAITMPQGALLKKLMDMGEGRLEMMDRLGIDAAVISCSPGAEDLPADVSVALARKVNDTLYALTKQYPGRYFGSALLPVRDVEASVAELERCVKDLGFVCWHTHSNYGTTYPDDLCYRPIFRKAAELGIYVYLHPQLPSSPRMDDCGFSMAGPGLGFTLDTVTTLTRLIVFGLFDEIPNLTMVLGHLGEALPFLLDRMDNRLKFIPNPSLKNKHDFSYYFRHNLYVTTSGNMSKDAFRCTYDTLGIDRIAFGSDYAFEEPDEMVAFIKSLPLNDEDRSKLYFQNAVKLGVAL